MEPRTGAGGAARGSSCLAGCEGLARTRLLQVGVLRDLLSLLWACVCCGSSQGLQTLMQRWVAPQQDHGRVQRGQPAFRQECVAGPQTRLKLK